MEEENPYKLSIPKKLSAEITATERKNREMIVQGLNDVFAGRVEDFWALFAPDVVFHEAGCLPYGGAHHGVAAARRAHERIHEVFDGLSATMEQVLSGGDLVIAYQTVTFKVEKTGKTATLPVSELFRIENGKIIEWRAMYFDANLVNGLLS